MNCKIADIEVDFSLNVRDEIDQDVVDRYAEIFDQLPPVVVFDLGELGAYLLADGFHRVEAAKKLGREEIESEIKEGNRKDTKIYALSANAKRGLPLTRAETREATKALLRECTERSDSWIAEDMGISKNTVDKYRAELESACQIDTLEKLIGKDGKEYPRKIKQPSWRDSASDTLLRCTDANVFSKEVGKALIKYPLEAQDEIAGQIEAMDRRPPSSDILDWIQKFEEIDDDILEAFLTGSLRIRYFDDIYLNTKWAEDDPTLELIDFIGEHERQFVAFDPVLKEACCVTPYSCIIRGVSDYEMTKDYHPVMRMMEGASLVGGSVPTDIYKVCFRQLFLNDEVACSAFTDEGIRIGRDQDYMFSAVIEARDSLRVQAPVSWNDTTVELIHPIVSKIKEVCIGHNFEITMADEKELLVIGKLVIGEKRVTGERLLVTGKTKGFTNHQSPITSHSALPITSNQSLLKSPLTPKRCTWRMTSTTDLFVSEDVVWKLAEKYDFDFEIVEDAFGVVGAESEETGPKGPEANPEAEVGEEEDGTPDGPDLREELARLCHTQWSGWMTYLFSKGDHNDDGTWTMPAWAVERWTLQMNTSYSELSGAEKDNDREEADKIIELMAL